MGCDDHVVTERIVDLAVCSLSNSVVDGHILALQADGLATCLERNTATDMNTSANQATILVIDQDAITLTGIAAVLDMSGYTCHCARDWEAAMKAARNISLDLIVCDLDLEDDHGASLCADLREIESTRGIPFVLLSRDDAPHTARIAHAEGAAFVLRKPYTPAMLTELVDNALWMPHLVNTRIDRHPPRRTRKLPTVRV